MTPAFEGVAHQHRRNGKRPKYARASMLAILSGQKVRSASVYDRCKTDYRRRARGASAMADAMTDLLFPVALAIIAIFYSAVGQAGGTGYVALMGLAGFAPAIIKPTALALNVLVSAIGCVRFYRLGLLTWRSAYPFAVLGLPFSLLGGALHLPSSAYQPVVGVLLLVAGGLCCKDDRRRWEDGDKLDPISFMRRYRKER
jgi:hypothetical protein